MSSVKLQIILFQILLVKMDETVEEGWDSGSSSSPSPGLSAPPLAPFRGPPMSPQRRHASLNRHLASPSARLRCSKRENCFFCKRQLEGKDLLNHLQTKETCRTQYCILYKVDSTDEIMNRIYSCISCFQTNRVRRINFKNHIKKNKKCYEHYCRKYELDSIDSVCRMVSRVKRRFLPSRTKSARRLENKRYEEKIRNFKTQADSYNDYKNSILFSNYKHCCKCKSNYNEYSAKEIKEDEEMFEDLELDKPENKQLRRNEKYFICNSCRADDSGNQNIALGGTIVKLCEVVNEADVLLYPSSDSHCALDSILEKNHVKVMFPNKIKATDCIPEHKNPKSRSSDVHKIYKTDMLKNENIASAYENELHKYQVLTERSNMFTADFIDFENKKLMKVEKLVMDINIPGSLNWLNKQKTEMRFWKDLYGALFLTVEINLPKDTLENVATSLGQEGYVITVEKTESASGEIKHNYLVHVDHKSSEDCSFDRCLNKVTLSAFIESHGFDWQTLGNKYLGTHVSSAHQKLKAFAKHIIQAPNSGIYGENFKTNLVFDLDGEARIVALIWPKEIEEINLSIASNYGKLMLKADLIDFVQRNISVSSDTIILKSTYGYSEKEAEELAEIVRRHQQHICDEGMDCQLCLKVELPSLETIVTEFCPDINEANSKKLIQLWKASLLQLSLEEKENCSTFEWLGRLTGDMIGEMDEDQEHLKLMYDDQEYIFEVEENVLNFIDKYSSSPMTGIYHYILSCSVGSNEGNIILKRLKIQDCFTCPFNPLLLKASGAKINVHIGKSLYLAEKLISRLDKGVSQQGAIKNSNVLFSHSEISFAEATSLFDKTKSRIQNSATASYVNAKSKRLVCFKKDKQESTNTFKLQNSSETYTMMKNIISRHFSRLNGRKLVLAETVSWYTFAGEEKSKEIYDLFKDAMGKIPLSEVECIAGKGEYLPTFLICKDGDVLKKFSKRRVLTYPKPGSSYEMMYSRLLLFYPLEAEAELYENNLMDMYKRLSKDEDDTIVNSNERKLFPMKIQKPNPLYVASENDDAVIENVEVQGGNEALDALLEILDQEEGSTED